MPITNFDKYEGVSLWCYMDDNGNPEYFTTEKSLNNWLKKNNIDPETANTFQEGDC